MNSEIHHLLDVNFLIGAIFWGSFLLIASVTLNHILRRLSKKVEQRYANPTEVHFAVSLLQIINYILAAAIYANIVPELKAIGSTLLAGAGLLSVAVGFASQNVLGNLVAGMHLIFYHPIREGDIIEVGTPNGTAKARVKTISLGYTILTDVDCGDEILVPNNSMINNTIVRKLS